MMEKFEILWELPKCDTETQSEQIRLEKTSLVDLLSVGMHKPSVGLKKKKMQYLYGEGTGTPLQYSCLENPMDGGV